MNLATLRHKEQSNSIDVELDQNAIEQLADTEDGQAVEIDVTLKKGYAAKMPSIYVNPPFESFDIGGFNHDVEVLGEIPPNKIMSEGDKLTVRVTVRVEGGQYAFNQ